MAFSELQGNELLEANAQSAEAGFAVGEFGLGMDSQTLMRGLDVIYRVGQQLQQRRSPGALAQEVIRILESTLGYDNTAILLVDRSTGQLKPFALSEKAYGQDFNEAFEAYIANHDLRLGRGAAGWVTQHGESLLSGDTKRDARFENLEGEIRSLLVVPIRIEGVVIGTVGTESRLVNAFTLADQKLLETVAGQIAIAIQNAHLFSRVRQQTAQSMVPQGPAHKNGAGSKRHNGSVPNDSLAAHERAERSAQPAVGPESTAELVDELRTRIEALDAFNHTVAHDLKNPLSILLGFAEVLEAEYGSRDDDVLAQAIQAILENGHRLENIINELLLLAEVRTVEQIPLEPLDMGTIVAETARRLNNFIEAYDAQIETPESWPKALGHQPWVEEIWVNYVTNAIKYGGPSPRVVLGGERLDDGRARFWVRDFGQGIPDSDQPRLFVPFTKLEQANTKGHGLGLSIAQRITKRLGGTVGLESEPGAGSLFWFTLPLADHTQR